MWVWALKAGRVEGANPVANTPKPAQEVPRERVLADHELALIWRCTAGSGDYHRIVRLLLLTATRADEVGGMMVSEPGHSRCHEAILGDFGRAHEKQIAT